MFPDDPDRAFPDFEERFDEYFDRAASCFPSSLRRSPLVGNALDKAVRRMRDRSEPPGAFDVLLAEAAREELTLLVQQVVPMVRKLAGRNRGLARVADEVPGEVFLALHNTGAVYDPGRHPFHSWLWGVVHNVARRHLGRELVAVGRSNSTADPSSIADPRPEPVDTLDAPPRYDEMIEQLCGRLPDATDRRIFKMSLVDGLPGEEVATALGLTANAVYKRVERIRKQLAPFGEDYLEYL